MVSFHSIICRRTTQATINNRPIKAKNTHSVAKFLSQTFAAKFLSQTFAAKNTCSAAAKL